MYRICTQNWLSDYKGQSFNFCKGEIMVSKQLTCCYKSLLGLVILILLLTASFTVSAQLEDFELVNSNEYLNLYINPHTTEIAVEDIKTNKMWFTNPQDRHKTASGLALQRLSSQFTIVHDPDGVQKQNYRYSVAYDQFDISSIENGVRVDYTIVEEWKPEHYVPRMIRQDRMEELLLSAIENERDKKKLLDVYYLVMLAPLQDGERLDIRGLDQEKLFGNYDIVVLNADYQEREAELQQLKLELEGLAKGLTSDASDDVNKTKADLEKRMEQLKKQLAKEKEAIIWRLIDTITGLRLDLENMDAISHDDVAQLIDTPTYLMKQVARFILGDIQKIVIETDYTPMEAGEDHLMNNLDPALPNLETFSVPFEYTLDGPNLLVRIPANEIEYPIDVEDQIGEKHTFPLLKISVLEYFGAADTTKDGYMFVPDGAGALIYLNNERLFATAYNKPVYGRDNALDLLKEMQIYPETIRLPVFGLKQDDQALFAIIEEGASLAAIKADISGRIDHYNRIYAEFTPLPKGEVSYHLGDEIGGGRIPVYQARMYQGDFVIRYAFLSGDDANYVGMANCYREYLINRYQLSRINSKENIPFYLELVGAIDKREPVLGIARNVVHPLTSFKQAQLIVEDLIDYGIDNIRLKYLGWLNGGVNHHYPSNASVEKALGGIEDFLDLINFMKKQGYEIYPSVGFLNVYRNTVFNDFNPHKDGARLLNGLTAKVYKHQLDTFEMNSQQYYYVLTPRCLNELTSNFLSDYQKFNLVNISLSDMASQVNSDLIDDIEKVIDREESLGIIEDVLKKMKHENMKIIVDSGNAYAIPYVDAIINMPSSSSMLSITNEEIPFYQMVVHGLIEFAGQPINLLANRQAALLKMLETGGYPYFIGSYKQSFEVKNTDFEHLYALHYGDWIRLAADVYQTANEILKDVQDQRIIDHKMLANNVYLTTYENGKTIIVNYNKQPVNVDIYKIGAESFIVMEGEVYEN